MSMIEAIWLGSYVVALLTVPSVLIQRRARPIAAVSWLLALAAVPPLALVAWWLFGRLHLERRRRKRRLASDIISRALAQTRARDVEEPSPAASALAETLPAALRDSVFPPSGGNAVRLLADTPAVHACWRDLIARAEEHLHVLFFAWHDDDTGRTFRDLLSQRAEAGCEVRVLVDAVGTNELPGGFFDPLVAAGAEVAEFLPVRLPTALPHINFRNHRKLIVADGRRGFTGGLNVTDEYLAWQDLALEIEGPGVQQLQEVFIDDWYFATSQELTDDRYFPDFARHETRGEAICETVASGPDQRFNAMREMLFVAISRCRARLWIATPYFVPDEALLMALRAAVYRGVDVRLYVPGQSDSPLVRRASRAFYPELLDGDIRVFEYDGMLHAKGLLFDDELTLIGSSNLDIRSFRLNFETGTFVTSRDLNAELAAFFADIERRSTPVGRDDVARHSYLGQLQDAVAHLLSPLL